MKQSFLCQILELKALGESVFTITIKRPQAMGEVRPGQFFQLKANQLPYLRRPISISEITEQTLSFTIIAKGEGTKGFQRLKAGDQLDVLGPLGNSYHIDAANRRILLIGAGIGVPPQAVLAEALAAQSNAHITVQLGFKDVPYMVERFTALTDDVIVASESGKGDYRGYVVDLTQCALQTEIYDIVYVCGPPIVIEKVAKLCERSNTKVQLLMEERMACGVGACMVCACKVKDEKSAAGFWYKRVCSDGPVFWGSEVVFDE